MFMIADYYVSRPKTHRHKNNYVLCARVCVTPFKSAEICPIAQVIWIPLSMIAGSTYHSLPP